MMRSGITFGEARSVARALAFQSLWLSNRPIRLASFGGIPICARCRMTSCPRRSNADLCVECNFQVCPRSR